MAYSITITNKDGLKYRFYDGEVGQATYNMVTKLFKQSLPNAEAEKSLVINLGREKTVSFPIKLLDTPNDDAAVATHTSTVKTISQKFLYLDATFITNGIEDLYQIDITTSLVTVPQKTGILTNFKIDFTGSNPSSLNGSIEFEIGGTLQ